jgi:protease IV
MLFLSACFKLFYGYYYLSDSFLARVNSNLFFVLFAVFAVVFAVVIAIGFAYLFSGEDFFVSQGTIAVIPIKGVISSDSSLQFFSSREIAENIRSAGKNSQFSAILLDIDSGGGEVVASKEIVYAVRSARDNKPVVAYIGGAGTSGAYYVASASDFIYADADSITGSIGVFSMVPNVEGLLEKLGVGVDILSRGDFKTMGSPFSRLSVEEREIFESILSETFEQFKSDVLEFRGEKISESDFVLVADGRILSGRQALKVNLIDATGMFEDAVGKAAKLAGISPENVSLKKFEKESFGFFDLFSALGVSFGNGFKQSLGSKEPLRVYS